MICYGCLAGLHEECREPKINEEATNPEDSIVYYTCCCWGEDNPGPNQSSISDSGGPRTRAPKSDEHIKDQESTGRKRAVAAVKSAGRFVDGMVCEWAGLRNSGGGVVPVVGCAGTILRAVKTKSECGEGESPINVHHGPDKSTLNNEQENLHVICSTCHNRWHGLNDKFYAKERPEPGHPFVPLDNECLAHDTETIAGPIAVEYNNTYWALPPKIRPKVPYVIPPEEDNDSAA